MSKRQRGATAISTAIAAPPSEELGSGVEADVAKDRRAEQAALRCASIMESSLDAVIGATSAGVITDWNSAAERLYGYTAAEALGRPISMLAPAGTEADVRALLLGVSRGESLDNGETVLHRKDGMPLELMFSVSPMRDRAGDVFGLTAIARDISERRHDERTIAALRAVAYSAGHIMDAERLEALTAAQAQDAFGVDVLVVYWWDEASTVLRPIGTPGVLGQVPLAELQRHPGEGLVGIVFQSRAPLIVEDYAAWAPAHREFKGRVGSAMAVPMNVGDKAVGVLVAAATVRRSFTEHDLELLARFAAEVAPAIAVGQLVADVQTRRQKAEVSEARASVYFRANPVPAAIVRCVDNVIVDVNDAFADLLGYRREELVGKSAVELGMFADPQEPRALLATLDRVGHARGEVTMHARSGELRFVLAFLELTEVAGEACRTVGCVDLTEQKRASALEQRQQVVEEATRAKSAFLANMSHELRTPLNAILGFSELLLEQLDISDKHKGYLNNVHEAGRHLLELINEVLDISRVEAGRMELHRESIALSSLLAPVIATTQLAADGRGVRFETGRIAASSVAVDPTRVRQILNNLLSNAVKFTSAGGSVRLSATVGSDVLLFEVKDSGIGIPEDSHGRVFGTFERFHERIDGVPGTGLGLALTKVLVELHGGTITFESAEGIGTTFFVRLPGSVPHAVPGARLLIVEDDRRDADLVVALAERRGLTADVVTTVAEALAAVERHVPAGIVLDLDLPDGRGETVLRELRKRHQHIPAVVVTALDVEPDPDLGADDHLTKPLSADRLDRWLERVAIHVEGRLDAHSAR